MIRIFTKTILSLASLALVLQAHAVEDIGSRIITAPAGVKTGHYVNPSYQKLYPENSLLGCRSSECGRDLTSREAVELWRGYCTEDCRCHRQHNSCGTLLSRRCYGSWPNASGCFRGSAIATHQRYMNRCDATPHVLLNPNCGCDQSQTTVASKQEQGGN